MRIFAWLTASLLVALFTISEARNRPVRQSVCRRCPNEPAVNQRVCVFNGVRTRTFPSECHMERRACQTGRDLSVVSLGPCPRPVRQPGGQQQGGDTESNESPEDNSSSNEVGDEVDNDTPTIAPAATTTMPFQPPSGTNPPPPPLGTGSTQSPSSVVPAASDASGQTSPISGTLTATSLALNVSLSTARQCSSLDSCVPSSAVCGTDGTTYPSQCVLEVTACVANLDTLTVAYAGFCVP